MDEQKKDSASCRNHYGRKWQMAERRKLPRKMGHAEGCKVLEQTVRDAADLGIDYLTVYAFSTETGSALRKRFRRLWFLWLLH